MSTPNRMRALLRAGSLTLGAALAASPALAVAPAQGAQATEAPSTADLMRLIQDQQAEIKSLEQRLAADEARLGPPQGAAQAVADTAPATQSAAAPAGSTTTTTTAATAAAAPTDTGELQALEAKVDDLQAKLAKAPVVDWKSGGPTFSSPDGFFSFHPRLRLLVDATTTNGSAYPARNIDGTELRDARLGGEGNIGPFGYVLEASFAGDAVAVEDAFISYKTKLYGEDLQFFLGNKLGDRSIDGSTYDLYVPFMQRNAVSEAIEPHIGFFGMGATARLGGDNWHVSAAIKGDDINAVGTSRDTAAFETRGTWDPQIMRDLYLHFGAWYFTEDLDSSVTSINNTEFVAFEFNKNLKVSATSLADPRHDTGYGLETGGMWRSLYAFGEYGDRELTLAASPNVHQRAESVEAGYFLTGEHAGFSHSSGTWAQTEILHPVTEGGIGAFELATRYDRYDYLDVKNGGIAESSTLGLNWYTTQWTRLMLDYVHWRTNNKVGSFKGLDDGDSVGLRGQLAF